MSDNEEDEKPQRNLLTMINEETSRKVTGIVRGILKKFSKTYGGSIIHKKDMLPSTLDKFKVFCENNNIDKKALDQYRIFVPYNIQMPQAIMKVKNPSALENKRLIIRYSSWKVTSPFPSG